MLVYHPNIFLTGNVLKSWLQMKSQRHKYFPYGGVYWNVFFSIIFKRYHNISPTGECIEIIHRWNDLKVNIDISPYKGMYWNVVKTSDKTMREHFPTGECIEIEQIKGKNPQDKHFPLRGECIEISLDFFLQSCFQNISSTEGCIEINK